jgi:predicted membrane-bound dolichyl-phosphate-mannose-protein mannosyltransferase
LFNLLFGDPVISLVFCSLFFGVLWVPVCQLVAEFYMSKKAALLSALLFALSPYVFLFTTIAYSEGILLFFVLTSWFFFKKGKVAFASALACFAALSRVVGILIILPMLIETLKSKSPHRHRNILLICLPILSFFVWLAYGQVTANDWLALIHTTEWKDLYSFQEC